MICDVMLDRMLEAEPAELAGAGDSALARHLRTCARCRGVAHQLRADSSRLAGAVAHEGKATVLHIADVRASRLYPRYVTAKSVGAVLVAAALLFMLVPRVETPVSDAAGRSIGSNAAPGWTGSAPLAPPRVDSPSSAVARAPAEPRRFAPHAFARPEAVQAVPIVAVASSRVGVREIASRRSAENEASVVVTPPSGMRAAVMRGSAPGVTVVWLH